MSYRLMAQASALSLGLAASLHALPALALEGEEPGVTVVETLIVTARPNPDDPQVVQDARALLARTPGAVAVVASETYERRFATHFADTLRNVPGVHAQRRYGEEGRLSIRGSGIGQGFHQRGVLFAQDGVPYADADGFSDFQGIDALGARYIEVWKGANTLRFGGAQLGGAINLVTPTGHTATSPAMLRLEAGSWDTRRVAASVAGVQGNWDGYFGVSGMISDGWRDNARQSQARGHLNLGYSLGQDREIRLIVQGADVQQDIPGNLTLDQVRESPRMANPGSVAGRHARDIELLRVSLQTRWRISENTVLDAAIWGWRKDLWHPVFQVIDQDSRTTGLFARADWSGSFMGRRAELFYGVSYRDGRVDALRFVNLAGSPGALTADGQQRASGADLFAESRLFVTPAVAVVVGGSLGHATRDYVDRLNPANDDDITYRWFAPRVGVMWEAPDGAQLYANITRSVEPPHYGALVQAPLTGFVPIEAQDAVTFEIGTRGRRGRIGWDVAFYRSHIDGEILNFITGPDIPAATFNADQTLHQGIEAGLELDLGEMFGGTTSLRQTWNWSDFRFRRDALWQGNRLPVVPEHQYRAELTWRHGSGVFLSPSVEWRISDVWVDYANTLKAPGYEVLGLTAGAQLGNGIEVFAEARNLGDRRYAPEFSAITDARIASTAVFTSGEGRSLFVGLRLRR